MERNGQLPETLQNSASCAVAPRAEVHTGLRTSPRAVRAREPGCGEVAAEARPTGAGPKAIDRPRRRATIARLRSLARVFVLTFAVAVAAACSGSSTSSGVGSIGVVLGRRATGEVFVREVPNPALTELAPDDELLFVGGVAIASLDEKRLREALRGTPGTTVDLTVVREGAIVRIRVVRTDGGAPPPPVSAAAK